MSLGVRGKLFAVSLALIVVTVVASGIWLEQELGGWLERHLEAELGRQARLARELVRTAETPPSIESFDPLAHRLGRAAGARVTLIDADGTVLGDSELTPEEVDRVENHAGRPEVAGALAHGHAVARRYSTTLGVSMLYLAVRYERPDGSGVVRLSTPLAEVRRALGRLRLLVVLAGLIGLAVAVFMGGLASHLMSRTFRELVENSRALARGEGKRIRIASSDELGRLAGSINRMAEELEATVAALAAERDRFETVLESMNAVVLAIDAEERITLANRAAQGILRIDGAPAGRLLFDVLRAPGLRDLLASGDETAAAEFDLPGGPPRRVLARVTALGGGSRLIVMDDVTEMRRLETVRRDFVANVSHELRTPVSVILASSETLLDGALAEPERARQFLGAIHANAERLTRLIADLLDLSRIEAGSYRLDPRSVALAPALSRALEAVGRGARDKGQHLDAARAAGLGVHADPAALDQVLLNLLDNAVKYTPARGRITVGARREGQEVRIEVADDGPGIEPRHQQRIFERFYRVDPGRSREMGGTGLGLSIVKHLVESMGGRVGVEPVVPHGSRFWITLPAASDPQS